MPSLSRGRVRTATTRPYTVTQTPGRAERWRRPSAVCPMSPAKRRNLAAVQDAQSTDRPPDLREAVKTAIGQMTWLTKADEAAVALAHKLADSIETAVERAEEYNDLRSEIESPLLMKRLEKLEAQCDVAKAVGYLGQQLQMVLRDLYGTPASRKDMKLDKPVGGRLAQLRAAAGS